MARRSVWRHRDLRAAVLGRSVSALGDDLAVVALVLFAYDAGWGTAGVAAVFVATTLPWAVGAPLAGRWADSVSSRLVTSTAALAQTVLATAAALLLALAPQRSPFTVAAVLVVVTGLNLAQVAASSAWGALVPRLVEADEVPKAVAVSQAGQYVAMVAAPGLAGVVVGAWGAQAALAADAVTFAVLAVAALRLRTVRRPEPAPGQDGMWAGVALVRADRLFSTVLGGVLVVLLVIQVVLVVDVFLLRDGFGVDARGYGFASLAVMGCGLLGALWAGRAGTVRRQTWGIVAALGTASLAAAGAGLTRTLWVAVAALCAVGVAFGALNVCVSAFTVSRTPDALRGRAYATVAGSTQLSTLLGLGVAAGLGAAVGPRTAFLAAGAVGAAVTLVVLLVVARTPWTPRAAAASPVPVVLPQSRPVPADQSVEQPVDQRAE